MSVRWINAGQMVADELTKEVSEEVHAYSQLVRSSGMWTLGKDSRAPPPRRNRLLLSPEEAKEEKAECAKDEVRRQTPLVFDDEDDEE